VVVEDNETDLYPLQRFLSAEPPVQHLLRARDGEEGIELLNEFASGGRGSLPALIVVDLNLPRVNGHEVLAHLRAQQVFQKTPVIVVTSCEAEAERKKAIEGGADGYFVKPFDIASYRRLPDAIAEARRVRAERLAHPQTGVS
jgi:CheY-like chemotaxis protein